MQHTTLLASAVDTCRVKQRSLVLSALEVLIQCCCCPGSDKAAGVAGSATNGVSGGRVSRLDTRDLGKRPCGCCTPLACTDR
jgi:hypothetical protein